MAVEVRRRSARVNDVAMVAVLLAAAGVGWWWSVHSADTGMGTSTMDQMTGPTISTVAFFVAWIAMMAAMMLPAILPAVRLFDRAYGRGVAAPTPLFVSGYLVVWIAVGVPAYFAWRGLSGPLADGEHWVARLAGSILVVAGLYQLSPLKGACLRHCRTPLSFFMHHHGDVRKPLGALRAGTAHGLICLGCCWALMAILISVGTMQLGWMLALSVLIFAEKVLPAGPQIGVAAAASFLVLGVILWIHPQLMTSIS